MPTKRTRRPKRSSSPYPSPFDPQPPDAPESEDATAHEAEACEVVGADTTGEGADSPGRETAGDSRAHKRMASEVRQGNRQGLTRREEAAVKVALENPTLPATEIARRIGVSPKSSVARRFGSNGDLRQHVRALLAGVGLDDKALVRKWAQLVQAKEVRHFAYQGKVLDTRHVVALDTRLKAMENVTKLARLYPATTEDQDQKTVGPPALMIQLNLGTTSQSPSPSGVTINLGPSPEVHDAQGDAAPGGSDTTR